jgi:hypothetical protein
VSRNKRSGNPAMRAWEPMQQYPPNPLLPMASTFFNSEGARHHYGYRHDMKAVKVEAWANPVYNGCLLWFEDGSGHFSYKRNDRKAIRDWRHIQSIKNEIAGPDREAIEIFPPEHMLVDGANEYHLWILPPELLSPIGFRHGAVLPEYESGYGKARQRAWEPGLSTGLSLEGR